MIKDLDQFGLVLLSCHSMAGSEFGAWNRTRCETRPWLRQDDTSKMGASDTIAAQYTSRHPVPNHRQLSCQIAELQAQAEGPPPMVHGTPFKLRNLVGGQGHRCELKRIPQIMGMEEVVANRPPWATPLRLLR